MKRKKQRLEKQEINNRKQKQEDKVMKTNFKTETGINIQKSISKSLAVVTSIALISISLNAQDLDYSLFEKISFNKNPLAMIHTSTKTSLESTTVNALAALTETETEDALQLEDWMMNESNFSTIALVETETESPLELESWMTDESLFEAHPPYLGVETEDALKLESWMTDENNFSNTSFQFTEETEKALELENWMLNEYLFSTQSTVDQPLELEHWMISAVIWK